MLFFFKQKTAYEMRISDWSSDVCSSDLLLSGGKIVDRKRLKDSNRLHCLVKLATLLATFRRFDCRLNLIEIDLPKSPAREVGLEQIDVPQGSHHVGRIIIKKIGRAHV